MQERRISSTVNHRAYDVVKRHIPIIMLMVAFIGINAWWLRVDDRIPVIDPPWHFVSSLRIWEVLQDFSLANLRTFMLHAFHPPLVGFLVRPFYFVLGENLDGAVLAMNLIFVPILVSSVYGIMYELTRKPSLGFFANLLLLCYPGILLSSRMFLLDLPLTAMVSLTMYLLIRQDAFMKLSYGAVFGLVLILGMLTKYPYAVSVGFLLIYALFRFRSVIQRRNLFVPILLPMVLLSFWFVLTLKEFRTVAAFLNPPAFYFKNLLSFIFIFGTLAVIYFLKPSNNGRKIIKILVPTIWAVLFYLEYRQGVFTYTRTVFYSLVPAFPALNNRLIGCVNLVVWGIAFVLFLRIPISTSSRGFLLLGVFAPLFVMGGFARFLLPCLPAMAIMTALVIGSRIPRVVRSTLVVMLAFNSLLLFSVTTFRLSFLPIRVSLLNNLRFTLIKEISAFEEDYGPPWPIQDAKEWHIPEILDALRKSGARDNEFVWYLMQHRIYSNATFGYYCATRKIPLRICALLSSPFDQDPLQMLRDPHQRYFADVEFFNYLDEKYARKLSEARAYLQEHSADFEILKYGPAPDDSTLIVYKKKDGI